MRERFHYNRPAFFSTSAGTTTGNQQRHSRLLADSPMMWIDKAIAIMHLLLGAFVISENLDEAHGYCNYGPDGTAETSVCKGGAQGGKRCNASRKNCESGCDGRWCTSSTNTCGSGWKQASWTTYTSYAPCCKDSPNYDPQADTTECVKYSACDYTGDFAYVGHKSLYYVKRNNLIALFSTHGDNASYKNKKIRIKAKGKTIQALVADTCGDKDCNGCCTKNAGTSGYLIDMEYYTVIKNFGSTDAVGGQICWQLVDTATTTTTDSCKKKKQKCSKESPCCSWLKCNSRGRCNKQ